MLDLDTIEARWRTLEGYTVSGGPDTDTMVFICNATPTLLALARAGRRLAEAAEEVSPDYGTIEDLRVALAAWREADGGH